jgi:hypothetical protein
MSSLTPVPPSYRCVSVPILGKLFAVLLTNDQYQELITLSRCHADQIKANGESITIRAAKLDTLIPIGCSD